MRALLTPIIDVFRNVPLQSMITAGMAAIILFVMPMMPSTTHLVGVTVDADVLNRLDELEAKGREGRPRTTGQFKAEKKSLEGKPGEVINRMGQEATDAVEKASESTTETLKDLLPGVEADSPLLED